MRTIRRMAREHTSDDVDKLVRDSGLATTVVLHLEGANHVRSVLRRIVHSVATVYEVRYVV